jgi:hypothetical protein
MEGHCGLLLPKNVGWLLWIRVIFLGYKMMEGLTLIVVFREGTTLTC